MHALIKEMPSRIQACATVTSCNSDICIYRGVSFGVCRTARASATKQHIWAFLITGHAVGFSRSRLPLLSFSLLLDPASEATSCIYVMQRRPCLP